MAIRTYTQQLESVQGIIQEVELYGQSNGGPGGQQLSRADLRTLYEREERLRPLAAAESAAGSKRGKRRIGYMVPTNG
jgi:hypothetical protein